MTTATAERSNSSKDFLHQLNHLFGLKLFINKRVWEDLHKKFLNY